MHDTLYVNRRAKVAEVLIIGAGASGSVAAKHLAEAGVDVVCLEQGPKVDNSEFWGDKPEWELMAQKRWHPNPNVRDLENDYPIDTSESDVNPLMYNAVGGSTILYAAHWQRFMPSDFRVKTLDGFADDWPFTYEDLEPSMMRWTSRWAFPASPVIPRIRRARRRHCRSARSG
jgi:choline dehydrogenase-like flavoprotein